MEVAVDVWWLEFNSTSTHLYDYNHHINWYVRQNL